MNTKEKIGLEKPKAIMLFIQMLLIILLFITSIYLLVFVIINKLGGWMITSYIFITLSIISIMLYSIFGYKKDDLYYKLAVIPFLIAILINIILPGRNAFQIAALAVLLAFLFGYLLKLDDDDNYSFSLSFLIIVVSLLFSVYSAINANTQFLGEINAAWTTYFAMYLSIFIPTIMCSTFALITNVKKTRIKE